MNLEDVFCEIKTDCCNIAHGWLPLLVIFDDHHLGTSMPSGGHPPHQLAESSLSFSGSRGFKGLYFTGSAAASGRRKRFISQPFGVRAPGTGERPNNSCRS